MIGDYMKTVNRIRIFCILTVLTGIMGYQLYTRQSAKEENIVSSTEEVARVEYIKETEEENILPVSQTTEYAYVIVEEGDYLTVYYADRTTLYEYTDIQYSQLPDALRRKIRKGYFVRNEAELFGFLENYSS